MHREYHIVGAGLAGCTLAWQLHWRGVKFRLFDDHRPGAASHIAAGIINPITGQRLARMPMWEVLWPAARQFYGRVERETGGTILHECGMVRVLDNAVEAERYTKRRASLLADKIVETSPALSQDFHAEHGSFQVPSAARVDVPAFLAASHAAFASVLHPHTISLVAVDPACMTIFSTGLAALADLLAIAHAFQPAKGEVLHVHMPGLTETRIINRGVWLFPRNDETALVGATYSWDDLTATPTDAGRMELSARLATLCNRPLKVIDHRAAVRPILVDRMPMIGTMGPAIAVLNGLGSKGTLLAPYYSHQLARHLLEGTPIEAAVNVKRWLSC